MDKNNKAKKHDKNNKNPIQIVKKIKVRLNDNCIAAEKYEITETSCVKDGLWIRSAGLVTLGPQTIHAPATLLFVTCQTNTQLADHLLSLLPTSPSFETSHQPHHVQLFR